MPRSVKVIVTATSVGNGRVCAFPDDRNRLFEIPTYKVQVVGTDAQNKPVSRDFEAFRFGVQLHAAKGVTSPRVVGLAEAQSRTLTWDRITTLNEMAWRVYDGFFVHRCPYDRNGGAGAIGCIEILPESDWKVFNQTLVSYTGVANEVAISEQRLAVIEYLAAPHPPLQPVAT